MALVKCPECNKENVSDSAHTCPSCGFEIKSYYAQKIEEEKKRVEEKELEDSIKMPSKPKFISGFGGSVIIGLIGGFFLLIGGKIFPYFILLFALYWPFLIYDESLKKYKLAQISFEEYKRREVKFIKHQQEVADSYKTPSCPNCKSANTKRIGTVNRAASVSVAGVASSKIGKQYKCKSCGHMW